jgi:hypothetical protein
LKDVEMVVSYFLYHLFIFKHRFVILFHFLHFIINTYFQGLLHAQHHSVYIPNYLQAFDYPNADETPSPSQQQDQSDYRFNDGFEPFQFDFFHTTTEPLPPIEFLSETSTIPIDTTTTEILTTHLPSTITTTTMTTFADSTVTTEFYSTTENSTLLTTTEQTTAIQNSTESFISMNTTSSNNETSPTTEIISTSTFNNTLSSTSNYSTENEIILTHEQLNETTENFLKDNSTIGTFFRNNSEFLFNLLNRTQFHSKHLMDQKHFDIHNITPEEAARHLKDRRTMQSLIHLLPPNLWSQLQNNFSMFNFNQSQYVKQSLPDPVLLAEAAAQAGLPGPGPYPIPDHFWNQNSNYYRNPPQIINNNIPITTCKFIVN